MAENDISTLVELVVPRPFFEDTLQRVIDENRTVRKFFKKTFSGTVQNILNRFCHKSQISLNIYSIQRNGKKLLCGVTFLEN